MVRQRYRSAAGTPSRRRAGRMATPCGAANGTAERGSGPVEESCHGVELGHLERLVTRHRRQDRGEPAREHRLARTGWSDHEDVVSARRPPPRAPGGPGPDLGPRRDRPQAARPRAGPSPRARSAARPLAGTRPPPERPRSDDLEIVHQRGLGRVRRRDDHASQSARAAAIATTARRGRDQPALERQLARERPSFQPRGGHLRGGCEHPHRDRQVEAGSFLAERPGARFTTTRRSGHSRPALSTAGRIRSRASCTPRREAGQGERRQSATDVRLDGDEMAADADDGDAVDPSVHGGRP